jgi:hypothetical protein
MGSPAPCFKNVVGLADFGEGANGGGRCRGAAFKAVLFAP